MAKMRARRISGSRWVTRSGSRPSGIARASRSAMPSRRSAWASNMTPPSELIRPPSKAAVIFLRRTAGKQNGRRLSSVMAGVRASIPAKGWLQQPNPTPDQQLTLLPPPLIRPRHEYDRLDVMSPGRGRRPALGALRERGLLGRTEPSLMHGGRTMGEYSEAFVAFDVAKIKHAVAVAVAEGGRTGEVRFLGEIENREGPIERTVKKLAGRYGRLYFCFEAGPTGYGLYRQLQALGHDRMVVAPALIPKRPGERVKTNRRDAVTLARLHRAGELTGVWVPDAVHEAVRDLVRAREAAADDLRRKRQQLLSFLLRHSRIYSGSGHWTLAHRRWLANQAFEHAAQQIVFQDGIDAIEDAIARRRRLEEQLIAIMPSWSMAPVVEAYQAMRGASFLVAVTFAAEIGDVRRFDNPRRLMSFLGLVPAESSTGDTVRRKGLTLAGNRRARRALVEAAWTYRYPARVSETLRVRLDGLPKAVRDIAWKAQVRPCARYRRLSATGKKLPVVVAAIAREMAAFLWAIGREVAPV